MIEDRMGNEKLAAKVLSNPDIFPDAYKSWLPRWLKTNVNFQIGADQLPDVETWKEVGASGNAAFENSWVNFGGSNSTAAYYKDPFGLVHLKGTAKSGTVPATIFTLPSGYRPQQISIFAVSSNGLFGVCSVQPSGLVQANAGSNVYFAIDGITFRAYS